MFKLLLFNLCIVYLSSCPKIILWKPSNDIVVQKSFLSWESGLRFVFFLSFLIWSVFDLLLSLKDRPAALKPIYLLILWSSLLAFAMGIIGAQEDGSQWIYLSFSWAFLQAFNTERRDKLWVKNLMLYSGLSVLILLLIVL